ncbi:MAG: hypothetical protein Q9211_006310 [Gyalolechia sp. 1 TL-2023]
MSGTNRPQQLLRRVLSLPPVQDRVFGENNPGGLGWDDYNNVAGFVGPVIWEQGARGDRIFPLRCQEWQVARNGDEYICNNLDSEQNPVRRCEGKERDEGAESEEPLEVLPDNIQLRYRGARYPYKQWDEPARRLEHKMPSRPICRDCVRRNYGRRGLAWAALFIHTGPDVDKRRWFRLCKKHSELETRLINAQPPAPNTVPQCNCIIRNRDRFKCNDCVDEEDWDWDNRAHFWREELLHTYKKQGRGKRPYVDYNKPARAKPVCAYKNCGGRAWYNTRQADAVGLSVCLGCSTKLIG